MAIKDYTTLCAAGPSEVLATIAVRADAALRERTCARCKATWRGSRRSSPNTPVCLRGNDPGDHGLSSPGSGRPLAGHGGDPEAVLAHWREAAGVVVAPGPVFGCPPDRFRLGVGRADLPEALEALAAVS